ncbi:AAA family ATPase [Moorena sp. SIO4G3]|uniref:nSTAND1 domain-containing NTPase n=1 Tax=Moorena sp. SIO4G3 TaxID=2607821 RepID=UPI00142B42D0|nr:AAA family ATPase [Moorena sp. SIO4G3]NEO77928.1 AAA family ATPase [Moorena sp. SIO4G3]
MTDSQPQDHHQHADHQQLLKQLAWAMEMGASETEFSLIFAHCNYTQWRDQLMEQLVELCSVEILPIGLTPKVTQLYRTIYSKIQSQLGQQPPQGIMVYGFEVVRDLEQLLRLANRVREEFRKKFHVPVLFWVDDRVYSQFLRSARDLASWGTGSPLDFQISTANVIEFIKQVTDLGFAQVLAAGAAGGLDHGQNLSHQQLADLRWAWQDLQHRQVELALDLEASVEFILGRGIPHGLNQSQEHYQRSLKLWEDLLPPDLYSRSPDPEHLIRYGCVLFYMGQLYRTYADQDRNQGQQHCLRARDYFLRSHDCFEQAKRPDLVAKFINSLGEILQRLRRWDELEQLGKKALSLHRKYPNPVWLAHDYGFLAAEVAISRSQWHQVKNLATKALDILTNAHHSVQLPGDLSREQLHWALGLHRGWYRLSLAKAYNHLGQPQQGIEHLDLAKEQTLPKFNPDLYIKILAELRQLYFDQGEYQKAFSVKAYQQSIEYQFRFRAFVGVGQLSLNQPIRDTQVADRIAASGREKAINDLVERIGRKDHKLTVIYGSSGVGKSFLLESGLIPRLHQESIAARDVEPVLLTVYPQWQHRLANRILGTEQGGEREEILDKILHQLQHNSDSNRLTVLIFDQFEEFFFQYPQPQQRRFFYQFLKDCLDLEAVKVILALREDYIYYLLECNDRLISLDVVNNDILSKDVLYYLGNFTQSQAKEVIERLTEQAKFSLEPELIEQLVKDLAAETGEVRPIELQVVGAQLETEGIVTLERYQQGGDKAKLVERYLDTVVTDCGPKHRETTWKLLSILTDDKQLRPIKTETELASVLNLPPEELTLILEILVGSGLVFQIPLGTEEFYQLVHDYLVDPIRKRYDNDRESKLAKFEEEKRILEPRKQEGSKLERAGATPLKEFKDSPFDALLAAMETGKALRAMVTKNTPLKDYPTASPMLALQRILDHIQEPKLGKHQGRVKQVEFSWDGQLLASAEVDGIVNLWDLKTMQVQELNRYQGKVRQVEFSRDGQHLASVGEEGIVRLWDLKTMQVQELNGYQGKVRQVALSWDGQLLASAGVDGIVRLWDLNTGQVQKLKGHQGWVWQVALSWDGQLLASAGVDGIVRLWDIKTSQVQELKGHQGDVWQVALSWDGQLLASAGVDEMVRLWKLNTAQVQQLKGHQGRVYQLALSRNGQLLASAGDYGMVRLWDINTGQVQQLKGHQSLVEQVEFSPDGQLLASAGGDRTVRLWDLGGRQIAQFEGTRLVFNPDGTQLATIDGDTIKLWRVDTLDGLLARGCTCLRSNSRNSYVNPELKAFCDRLLDN